MTSRTALLVALVAGLTPAPAHGQRASSSDSLVRRIAALERQNAEFEQRLQKLEALAPPVAQHVVPSSKWGNLSNWRQLRTGMTMPQVRALLGEPDHVDVMQGIIATWTWGEEPLTYATFRDNRLVAWSEPSP